ncbi:bifunctional 3-(3-hydroxy-phenyl)propionate/3-hydroxycinnamic acid hydroxylase MhpA [Amycolatopsis pigmentata]|uniref:Bifunctional 3-(3-hydroxy-phenyl)propionate/3-hydroxycinnamic acid hydroxylase n=1 Tax=Amycolatopsis pigmentata TaxID=450801 RepID=A0ABW5FJW0_9PSEU
MVATDFDVLIVGYGPTGMVAAALLGQQGHRVGVVERYPSLYNLPRAATFDDETMRLFQKLGIADSVSAGARAQATYDWVNAAGEVLIRNRFSDVGLSGWPEFNMMFQPVIEDALDALCRSTPGIEINRGMTLVGVAELDGLVRGLVETPDGTQRSFSARYLLGCDGGNSTVGRALGVEFDDYEFQEPWLVCDFRLKRKVDLPMAQQLSDPRQPTSIISIGPHHHRFSFMLDAVVDELDETVTRDVWERVSRWITADDAELIRIAPYTFRSTVAQSWRQGRILLAGDAAHQMPPFLGQGMCSGLRDAHNLAWKLSVVLSGDADDRLLDTYAAERSPHVRAIVERAVELGRVQTVRDPVDALERDAALVDQVERGESPQAFQFPGYDRGLLDPASSGKEVRGMLFPQTTVVDRSGARRRFDDIAGGGWVLLVRDGAWLDILGAADLKRWGDATVSLVALSGSSGALSERSEVVGDVDGFYAAWLERHGAGAVLVRPDRYVFGSASSRGALPDLLAAPLEVMSSSPA